MRALDRLCYCYVILELIEPAVEIQHLYFAGLHQDRECLVIHRLCRGRIDPIPLMLEQCATATNAKLQPPTAQVVEHTDLLVKPQRMVQGEDVYERTESDPPSPLRHGGEKYASLDAHVSSSVNTTRALSREKPADSLRLTAVEENVFSLSVSLPVNR